MTGASVVGGGGGRFGDVDGDDGVPPRHGDVRQPTKRAATGTSGTVTSHQIEDPEGRPKGVSTTPVAGTTPSPSPSRSAPGAHRIGGGPEDDEDTAVAPSVGQIPPSRGDRNHPVTQNLYETEARLVDDPTIVSAEALRLPATGNGGSCILTRRKRNILVGAVLLVVAALVTALVVSNLGGGDSSGGGPADEEAIDVSAFPSVAPSIVPTTRTSAMPSSNPTLRASAMPSSNPTLRASAMPSSNPTLRAPEDILVQLGQDIYGSGGYFGQDIALSANGAVVAVGAPWRGEVHVYSLVSTGNWTRLGNVIAANDLGGSVVISGDGQTVASSTYGRSGAIILVYRLEGDRWKQIGSAIDSGLSEADRARYGYGKAISLSADGRSLAVGAYYEQVSAGNETRFDEGTVRVYRLVEDDWAQIGGSIVGVTYNESNIEDCCKFIWAGESVSLSADGTFIAVVGSNTLRVYRLNGGDWTQIGDSVTRSQMDHVSLSGNGTVAAFSSSSSRYGGAGVYSLVDQSWVQQGQWIPLGRRGLLTDFAFSADAGVVVLGDSWGAENGPRSGKAQVYGWNGTDWEQIGLDIDGQEDDAYCVGGTLHCQMSVAVSTDGRVMGVGFPKNDGGGDNAGVVRLFQIRR